MIIGIDEVNFSPSLAGDCVICALARKPGMKKVRGVKDSKQLTPKRRLELFGELQKLSIYSISLATVNSINLDGIYLARNYGIAKALMELVERITKLYGWKNQDEKKVIIYGHFSKKWIEIFNAETYGWFCKIEGLVNGDEKVYEISAASIVARVYCDALFVGFRQFYPGYRLEKNHGSPDKKAYEALRLHGPTPYHRTGGYAKEWWKKILKEGSNDHYFINLIGPGLSGPDCHDPYSRKEDQVYRDLVRRGL